MKLKKEYAILLAVIAVLTAYLFMRSENETHFDLPRLAAVESGRIDRLTITKGERAVELRKADEQWVAGPKAYAGDSIKIKNMVRTAADLTLTALVSESGSYTRYGLDDGEKIHVQAFSGKEKVRDFAIGRRAPTHQHTFVTLSADPKVYHARGNIDVTYDHTIAELRDETVLKYEKSDITALTLTRDGKSTTLTRREKAPEAKAASEENQESKPAPPQYQWADASGKPAETADVNRLLAHFSNLKCDDFLEDDAKEKLKDPVWTVTLKSDRQVNRLSIFDKEDKERIEFPGVSSGSPYAFVLHKSRVEAFEKSISKLLTPEPQGQKK